MSPTVSWQALVLKKRLRPKLLLLLLLLLLVETVQELFEKSGTKYVSAYPGIITLG